MEPLYNSGMVEIYNSKEEAIEAIHDIQNKLRVMLAEHSAWQSSDGQIELNVSYYDENGRLARLTW